MPVSLLLSHVSAPPNRLISQLRSQSAKTEWVFLGQDYLRLLEWQATIGAAATQMEISSALSSVAENWRKPFLDLITDLGRQQNSIAWWASRLSERNTMVSSLFLYCCYLKVAHDALANAAGSLCVISESWEVLESLAEVAGQAGCQVVWIARPKPGARSLLFLARTAKRLERFCRNSISQRRCHSLRIPAQKGQKQILLRTWVDETCFGEDGVFRDRYLPGLGQWLSEQGFAVTTIPVLFNVNRTVHSAWNWFGASRQQFLNPFEYYQLKDYRFAIGHGWRQLRMKFGPVHLDGIDLRRLFEAELKGAFCDDSCLESILSYRLPKRLAANGIRVDLLIDEFENMVPDKLLNLGFRRYLPATRIVGFQHGALFPLLLCNFMTSGEAEFAPMPDRVVCNGSFFRDILVSEGLPAEIATVGPALRYEHLRGLMSQQSSRRDEDVNILVPLPLVIDSAVELFSKVSGVLGDLVNVRVLLKAHPMSSAKLILQAAKCKKLPSNFEFVQSEMGELLGRSKLAIALSSSTVHEVLAAGIPVIVVGREAALDLNPLGWYPDLNQVIRREEDLRQQVLKLLALSPGELAGYKKRAREVLQSSFAPVTESLMQVFVDRLVSAPEIPFGGRTECSESAAPVLHQ